MRLTQPCVFNWSLFTILALFALGSQPAHASEKALTVPLEKGNLLSVINPKTRKDAAAKQALKTYYAKAIPLATRYGYQNHGALKVVETLKGKGQPGVFVLATWPSQAADAEFEANPEWLQYKKLRKQIWHELKFYKAPVSDVSTLRFVEDKFYTWTFSWFDVPTATHQQQAVHAIERAGGQVMHQMQQPRYVSHSDSMPTPTYIMFAEWDSEAAYRAYVQGELANPAQVKQEIYLLKPVIRKSA